MDITLNVGTSNLVNTRTALGILRKWYAAGGGPFVLSSARCYALMLFNK